MDYPRTAAVTGMALVPAVLLFWLMDMNFLGWLGAWFAADAGAWLVGILIGFALCFGFAALWTGNLAQRPGVKKIPAPLGGALYGLVIALVFATLVPLILSAVAGNPGMAEGSGTAFDSFPAAFGVRVVPALPDLGFNPPLRGFSETDWVSRDDYAGRFLPFALAFALFGVVLQLFGGRAK